MFCVMLLAYPAGRLRQQHDTFIPSLAFQTPSKAMLQTELETLIKNRLKISKQEIIKFCQKWKIIEFSLFGSVLREDFNINSDIDVLITFAPSHEWHLFDFMNMQRELEDMFGRSVDLIQKKELQNPYRRAEILRTHQVIYAG